MAKAFPDESEATETWVCRKIPSVCGMDCLQIASFARGAPNCWLNGVTSITVSNVICGVVFRQIPGEIQDVNPAIREPNAPLRLATYTHCREHWDKSTPPHGQEHPWHKPPDSRLSHWDERSRLAAVATAGALIGGSVLFWLSKWDLERLATGGAIPSAGHA